MVTRIKVKPDADGKIRVVCGNDIIEIDPGDNDWMTVPIDLGGNPVDDPYTFFNIAGDRLTRDRIDAIIREVGTIAGDPTRRDPRRVVVGTPGGLDVHGTAELADRLADALPGAGLVFDMRKPGR